MPLLGHNWTAYWYCIKQTSLSDVTRIFTTYCKGHSLWLIGLMMWISAVDIFKVHPWLLFHVRWSNEISKMCWSWFKTKIIAQKYWGRYFLLVVRRGKNSLCWSDSSKCSRNDKFGMGKIWCERKSFLNNMFLGATTMTVIRSVC